MLSDYLLHTISPRYWRMAGDESAPMVDDARRYILSTVIAAVYRDFADFPRPRGADPVVVFEQCPVIGDGALRCTRHAGHGGSHRYEPPVRCPVLDGDRQCIYAAGHPYPHEYGADPVDVVEQCPALGGPAALAGELHQCTRHAGHGGSHTYDIVRPMGVPAPPDPTDV